jgi:hypothetical protein
MAYSACIEFGRGDIHRVDLLEAGVVLVIAEGGVEAVFPGQRPQFGLVAADERGEAGVAPGVGKGRENGDLGDVAEADDGVSNGRATNRHDCAPCTVHAGNAIKVRSERRGSKLSQAAVEHDRPARQHQ